MLHPRQDGESHAFDEATAPEKAHFGAGDIGWQALAPALGCTILATLIVAARWYSRCRLAQCLGIDDYVILLSLVRLSSPPPGSWPVLTDLPLRLSPGQ